jgi:histidinol-phosphatase
VSFSAELAFANDLADMADDISMRYFRNDETGIREKSDGTPVTQADEEIERMLRKEIAAAFPNHGVLGEEEGETEGSSQARWILDPIDGTKNFSWGIPVWGTLIALESEGDVVCGVVSCPALGERYAAAAGLGATRNGETIRVSTTDDVAEARVGFTSVGTFIEQDKLEEFMRYIRSSSNSRGIGDCYGHMLVASGSLDAMVEPRLNAWDLAPLIVIVREAGGRLSDLSGRDHIWGQSVISTNGLVHESVLGIFGG